MYNIAISLPIDETIMHVKAWANQSNGWVLAASDEKSMSYTRTIKPNIFGVIALMFLWVLPGVLYLIFGWKKETCNLFFKKAGKHNTQVLLESGINTDDYGRYLKEYLSQFDPNLKEPPPPPPPPLLPLTAAEKLRGWITLGVLGVIIVGSFALLSVDWQSGKTKKPIFAWQKRCDAACAAKLGDIPMAGIQIAESCLTLQAQRDAHCSTDVCSEWKAAVQDQMDYRHCPGSAPRSASDPYHPLYPWQKRCGEDCANNLGPKAMARIDAYDCARIRELLPYARNPKLWSDYDQNYDLYAEESKAIPDKYESLHCK